MVLGGNGEKRANLPAFSNWRRKGWLAVDLSSLAAGKTTEANKIRTICYSDKCDFERQLRGLKWPGAYFAYLHQLLAKSFHPLQNLFQLSPHLQMTSSHCGF